jgi:4-amino-4-deoxy-L-arabinose transferase-like glycosyltransferase
MQKPTSGALRPSILASYWAPVLAIVSLVTSCVVWSAKKMPWGDECYTYVEIREVSPWHLFHSVQHLGGAGMPLFYLTIWPWARLFGLSPLSLRLYSCLGICAAFITLYLALRPRFTAAAAFLAVSLAMFSNYILLQQSAEARTYGLYLFLAALAVAAWLPVAENLKPSGKELVALCLSQAGLVLGHVLGLMFGGTMLAALVISDRFRRDLRPKVYLSLAAGWLALLLWFTAIVASSAVAKPHGWNFPPKLSDFAAQLSFHSFIGPFIGNPVAFLLAFLLGMGCIGLLIFSEAVAPRRSDGPPSPALILAFSLLVVPVILFVVSRTITPIFVPRYLLPSCFGIAILLASWLHRRNLAGGKLAYLLGAIALVQPVATAIAVKPFYIDVQKLEAVAGTRPVVSDWLVDFMAIHRSSKDSLNLIYPLDWDAALQGSQYEVPDYHLMRAYQEQGFLTGHILDTSTILQLPSFLVLDNAQSNWFRERIASNPCFTWRPVAHFDSTGDTRTLIEVTRVQICPN